MPENANTLLISRAIVRDEGRILLIKRSESDSHNSGMWEFPGGKVDAGEELADGLAREVFEETGLSIEAELSLTHVHSELAVREKYRGRLYVALFFVAHKLDGDLVLSMEHGDAIWESPDVAEQRELTPESKLALLAFRQAGVL